MSQRLSFIFCFLMCAALGNAQYEISELGQMPQETFETSGLIFIDGKAITHNDSGNNALLFEIDTTTVQITRTVAVSNAENVDWEDIAHDEEFIYIGDFGNNNGNRQDLRVYRISKQDYIAMETVTAEQINFSYEDQVDFVAEANSDWDAEALFVLGDELIVLTKQWKNNGTVAYSFPKTPGTYVANKLDGYGNIGLVTGADYDQETNVLSIVGYSQTLSPFVMLVEDLSSTGIFEGKIEKTTLDIGFAQTEGIVQIEPHRFLLSCEYFSNETPSITSEARLFSLKIDDTVVAEEPETPGQPTENETDQLILYREVGSTTLNYQLNTNKRVLSMAIFDATGSIIRQEKQVDLTSVIDLLTMSSSIYYLTFYLEGTTLSRPFVR
ncbi:T9SS C-terminal target domain-containing protein [Maribacter algicola]|uniref:T9SS C-terminal target domain-containing protein n=1 Tax=Meishania litoralis TaxID=3434685 RepID=A0ACC7LIX1_9FLAO